MRPDDPNAAAEGTEEHPKLSGMLLRPTPSQAAAPASRQAWAGYPELRRARDFEGRLRG